MEAMGEFTAKRSIGGVTVVFKRTMKKIAAVCLMILVCMPAMETAAAEKPQYLKSVTYFGDEWPINFWGSEDKNMESQMEQIAQDGFNSIILVIPWREFQPSTAPVIFNEAAFEKLNDVMECAERHGLWVVLRVGYSWDYYGAPELPERFRNVLIENSADRKAWLDYNERIYRAANVHSNFAGGFITWEDFWDFVVSLGKDQTTAAARVKMASAYGYTNYLKEHYTLLEVGERYGKAFSSFDEVYLPSANSPAMGLFYEFYDAFLNNFLRETQEVFPGISMEVRADGDIVYDAEGSYSYYSHSDTYPCAGADYTALMYSVSMGQKNEGERISSAEAIQAMQRNLNAVFQKSGGKKLYIEQFLYMDTTEEFNYNAQIEESQLEEFVMDSAAVLRPVTCGYGLWVYRNYVNNCVYNGQFGFDGEGWSTVGNVGFLERNGSKMAVISAGGHLSQKLDGRLAERGKIYVSFTADSDTSAKLTVSIGDKEKVVRVNGLTEFKFSIPWQYRYDINFTAAGKIYVDDVRVYTFDQNGGIYDERGNALGLAPAFRELNSRLN